MIKNIFHIDTQIIGEVQKFGCLVLVAAEGLEFDEGVLSWVFRVVAAIEIAAFLTTELWKEKVLEPLV